MFPLCLATPGHTAIQPTPVLAMITNKSSYMHHSRAISGQQSKEDPRMDLALECSDVLADGRRGIAEIAGRGLDGTAGDDRAKDAETMRIEHFLTIQRYCMKQQKRSLVLMCL